MTMIRDSDADAADVRSPHPVSYRALFGIAWPIMLANIAQPLLGLVDTAVLGNVGSVQALGAIALGALIFSCVYWSFGFLRMGTTGFVAQAYGAGNSAEVRAALLRGVALGAVLGGLLIVLRGPIMAAAFWAFSASAEVESLAADYVAIRFWGAPAALSMLAMMGMLIGLGRTREVLIVQLVLNGLNIVLDVWFAGVLGWGAPGIALGTAISEWVAVLLAVWIVLRALRPLHRDAEPFWPIARLRNWAALRHTLRANADIMIRTLFMLFAFAWFTNHGAVFGDATLAANHVLLQFVTLSAYFLDGYAHAAESVIGQAAGGRARQVFDTAVRRTTHFAVATAVVIAAGVLIAGPPIIHALTDLPSVRALAQTYLIWCALYIALSCAAFQLDGIFIGATRTRAMRNASAVSALLFIGLTLLLVPKLANHGLWLAFLAYVVLRALTLAVAYPALRRSIAGE